MIDTDFLDHLGRFSLIVRKRMTSHYQGARKSIAQGRGLTLMDFREYAPGDDLRTVDWKIYARTDDLYIKRYEEERSLTVHIIVDHSASMDYGGKTRKFDYASMLGIGFAFLTMKENEKFEFSTFAEDLTTFKPRRGMHQLANMVDYLSKLDVKGHSKFEEVMKRYKKMIKSRSLIIIVSDFLFDINEIKEGLSTISRNGKHEIKVIQVLDRKESDLDVVGDVNLHDAESGVILRTHISPRLRKNYQYSLNEHSANIHELCNKMGMSFYFVTTDVPIFDAFYGILKG